VTDTPTLTEFLLNRITEDEHIAHAAAAAGQDEGRGDDGMPGEWWLEDDPRELARYSDDFEEVAWRRAGGVESTVVRGRAMVIDDVGGHTREHAEHIAHHQPARVLADCQTKRRIIALYIDGKRHRGPVARGMSLGLRDALCLLAQLYGSHPDFDPRWTHDADHPDFHDR
jgi:hypothetical protein